MDGKNYLEILQNISRTFNATLAADEILHSIVASSVDAMDLKGACLFLCDERTEEFVPVAHEGLSDQYYRDGLTPVSKVIASLAGATYFYSKDVTTDERLDGHEAKKTEGIVSLLGVPVMVAERLIGVLAAYTAKAREFSPEAIDFLTALAEQGAMAIEHARLVTQLREKTKLFLELAANLNSSLDVKKILHCLSDDIAGFMNVKGASVLLLDETEKNLQFIASSGLSEEYTTRGGGLTVEESVAETLAGHTIMIEDVAGDERVEHKAEKEKEGIVSILSVPIKTQDKVIGALRLYAGTRRRFSEDEIMLMTAVAHLGGLAIKNASMYLLLEKDMVDMKEELWSHRSWF